MTDEYNQTALYTACITGFDDIAEMLISQGANVNVPTVTGLTPLHFASLDVAKHLIRAGANVNAVSKGGRTPLSQAIRSPTCGKVLLLTTAGANLHMGITVRVGARHMLPSNTDCARRRRYPLKV
eukprot:m.106183 g.106183  ORF g.106183 m.106183 type:complete len:125 (+) comp15296_c2_seq37:700-1074(+)